MNYLIRSSRPMVPVWCLFRFDCTYLDICWIPFLNVFLDENKDEDCHLKRRERLIELKRHEDDPDYTPDGENENYQVFNNSNGR